MRRRRRARGRARRLARMAAAGDHPVRRRAAAPAGSTRACRRDGRLLGGGDAGVRPRRARRALRPAARCVERWRIERAGDLAWADAMRLDDDMPRSRASPPASPAPSAFATVLYVGADAARHLALARAARRRRSLRAPARRLVERHAARARLVGAATEHARGVWRVMSARCVTRRRAWRRALPRVWTM